MRSTFAILLLAVTPCSAFSFPPESGEKETFFYQRQLRLKNETTEKLSVEMHVRTYQGGSWVWLPVEPGKGKGFVLEMEPGAEARPEYKGAPVLGSRIRLLARGSSLTLDEHRDRDLWLVPEKEEDEHRYKAASIEIFTHSFKIGETLAKGDTDSADPMTSEAVQPPVMDTVTPPMEPIPTISPEGTGSGGGSLGGGSICPMGSEAGGSGGGVIGGGDAGGGGGAGGVDEGAGSDTGPGGKGQRDLAVESFTVSPSGEFQAVVANLGEGRYLTGRMWRIQRQEPVAKAAFLKGGKTGGKSGGGKAEGGKNGIIKSGIVPPIPMKGGKVTIRGKMDAFKAGLFAFALTPGDSNPENDKADANTGADPMDGPVAPPPGKEEGTKKTDTADLAVTDLRRIGSVVTGKITNLGPGDYKTGRSYTLSLGGRRTKQNVTPLRKGESQTVKLSYPPLEGLKLDCVLTLSPGDSNPGNDVKTLKDATGSVTRSSDLAIVGLTRKGNRVAVTVRNLGNGTSAAGRTLTISTRKGAAWMVQRSISLPALNGNASQTFEVPLATLPVGSFPLQAALNSVAGENAGNDRKMVP